MAVVPEGWTRMMGRVPVAMVARAQMKDGTTQQLRDAATQEYVQTVDAIMDDLTEMRGDGTLGRITLLLSKKERR